VHYPERAGAIMHSMQACHGGKVYRSQFHARMRGQGVFADMIAQRFKTARRRHGLDRPAPKLNTTAFRPPAGPQLSLFGRQ